MTGFVSQEKEKFERLAKHMKFQQRDLQTKSAQIAQVRGHWEVGGGGRGERNSLVPIPSRVPVDRNETGVQGWLGSSLVPNLSLPPLIYFTCDL